MKKNNINIDELFRAARNEPPVLTKDSARSLVENHAGKSLAHNHFKIYKGAKPMNILIGSLAAAGAISFFALNPFGALDNDNKVDNQKPDNKVSVTAPGSVSQPAAPAQENKDEAINPQEEQNLAHTSPSSNADEDEDYGRIDIKGVKLIELDDTQLMKLGLKRNQEGLEFHFDDGDGDGPKLHTLLVRGGLMWNEKINPDPDICIDQNLFPRLVTDNAGNRRMAFYDDEDEQTVLGEYKESVSDTDNNTKKIKRSTTVLTSSVNGSDPEDPDNPRFRMRMEFNTNDSCGSMDFGNMNNLHMNFDSLQLNINQGVNSIMIDLFEKDSLIKKRLQDVDKKLKNLNLDVNSMKDFRPFPPFSNQDEIQKLESQARELDKQSIEIDKQALDLDKQALKLQKELNSKNNEKKSEKIDELREQALELRDKASELRDQGAELRDQAAELRDQMFEQYNLPLELNLDNLDSIFFDFEFDNDSANGNYFNHNLMLNGIIDVIQTRIDDNIDPLMSEIKILENNINNLIKINKLVPVVVHMGKNPEPDDFNNNEDFDFILWYEPTEEFLKILPEEYRARIMPEIMASQTNESFCQSAPVSTEETYFDIWRSCNGAIENLAVYPNPASNFVNVKFDLSQPRHTEISLHDLSGRKIRQLSSMDQCPTGSIDQKFELKDLMPGMYLISVQTDLNEQAVQRIIVEK